MVPVGSMMRPLPIAPLDMVWTGYWCIEYIQASAWSGRAVVVVASLPRPGQWGAGRAVDVGVVRLGRESSQGGGRRGGHAAVWACVVCREVRVGQVGGAGWVTDAKRRRGAAGGCGTVPKTTRPRCGIRAHSLLGDGEGLVSSLGSWGDATQERRMMQGRLRGVAQAAGN